MVPYWGMEHQRLGEKGTKREPVAYNITFSVKSRLFHSHQDIGVVVKSI